jgi:glycogen debranching enzyme
MIGLPRSSARPLVFWLKNRDPQHWRDSQQMEHVLGKYIISDKPMSEEEWATSARSPGDCLAWALEWLLGRLDDAAGAGYLWVRRASDSGNRSQVWEDSSDAFHDEKGLLFDTSRPFAPIAPQGYAYDALLGTANLLEHSNVPPALPPLELRRRAEQLRAMTLKYFWQPDLRTFAHALTIGPNGVASPVRIVASAPGHLLASKLLDGAELCCLRDALVCRLFEADMLAGARIRTKSTRDPLFRPGAYHNGSVWPMDTGVIADGLRQHGYIEQADDLDNCVISACATVGNFPEFFRGNLDGAVSINRESLTYLRSGRLHFREQPPQIRQG